MAGAVLTFTDRGIYCPAGDFHIDPARPVDRAIVTHGHSDHARPGHGAYLASRQALPVIRQRLGNISAEGLAFGETRRIGEATVSFHPAGHVPGSAQVRVEVGGEVWVVSGDYKTEADGFCEAWDPVACHAFVSECTFGLPLFRWAPQAEVVAEIAAWWQLTAAEGRVAVIGAYGFGKAQRLLAALPALGPILTHPAVERPTEVLRAQGYRLPATLPAVPGSVPKGALVVAPPQALGSEWAEALGPRAEAIASGWMALRKLRRQRGPGTGFVLSDHADWPGLNHAIRATGAARVFVMHGFTQPFCRWLTDQGYDAGLAEPIPTGPSAGTTGA